MCVCERETDVSARYMRHTSCMCVLRACRCVCICARVYICVTLQFLVGEVDAELFEAVTIENLETEDIQNTYAHTCTYTHVNTCIHTYTRQSPHTHTHTHTHSRTNAASLGSSTTSNRHIDTLNEPVKLLLIDEL